MDSNRIVSLAVASRDLTNTLVMFRLERGDTLSYLAAAAPAAPDNIMTKIADLRATAQKNYAQALQSLGVVDAPGLAAKARQAARCLGPARGAATTRGDGAEAREGARVKRA